MKVKEEIKERPLFYLFMTVLCTAITLVGTNTIATNQYVDKRHQEMKEFVLLKNNDICLQLRYIKLDIKDLNKLILGLYKQSSKDKK